jgi:serine/threonine protein kinase/WD40 repeat protein
MALVQKCPACGALIPEGTPERVCPQCALSGALRLSSHTGDAGETGAASPQLPVRDFGDYELLEEVGRGGMGVVYKARQRRLDRLVAVKLLLHGRWSEPAFARRFRLEAEAAARLEHPNIVTVHEFGEHDGQPYYTMRFVEGRSLDRELAGEPMPARRAAQLVTTIARAVHFAHQHGVLHRDLKPHNVLIDAAGRPHLTDFGLAKLLEHESGQTQTETVLGSPSFMAPEQAGPGKAAVTTAVDVYSLGAMLFMLLTGRAPFTGATPMETIRHVIEDAPPPLRKISSLVPPDLETVCLKCLQKEPARRYGSAEALADDLEHWLHHEPIAARPPTRLYRTTKFVRRHRIGVAAASAIVLSLCAGLIVSANSLSRERTAHARAVASERAEATLRRQAEQAREAETVRSSRTARDLAERLLAEGRSAEGLAWLVHAARKNPGDRTIAPRLASVLAARNFWLPAGPPLTFPSRVANVHHVEAGRKVAVYCDDGTVGFIDLATGVRTQTRLPAGLKTPGVVLAGRVTIVRGDDDVIRVLDPASGRVEREFRFGQKIAEIDAANKEAPVLFAVLEDRSVVVADTRAGRPMRMPRRNPVGRPTRLTPDGRWLLRPGARPEEGEIWDVASGELHARALLPGAARWADLSPDGARLVAVYQVDSTRSAFLVYSVPNLEPLIEPGELIEPEFHGGAGISIGFSPDGRWFSIVSQSGQQFFESATGARVGPFVKAGTLSRQLLSDREKWAALPGGPYPETVTPLIVRVDDRWCRVTATPLDARVGLTVCDLITGQPIYPPLTHAGGIVDASVSEDGSTLIGLGMDGCAILWDLRTGRRAAEPTLLERGLDCAVAIAPDGRELVIGRADGTVQRMRTGPGPARPLVLTRRSLPNLPAPFLPAGPTHLLWLQTNRAVALDVASGQETAGGFAYPEPIRGGNLVIRSDRKFAVAQTLSGTWQVWELGEHGVTRTIPLEDAPRGPAWIDFSARADLVAVIGRERPESPRIWTLATGKPVGEALTQATAVLARNRGAECFSPDGRSFACGATDGGITIWEVATSQRLVTISPPRIAASRDLEFSPDGALIAAGNTLNSAGLWKVANGQLVAEIAYANSLRFSPQGDHLLVLRGDSAQICDGHTGATISEPMVHPGVSVLSARFSPDGRRVVSGATDSTARIWNAATGLPLSEPLMHGSRVTGCAFSSDGRFVRTEGGGRFLVWSVPPDAGDAPAPAWLLALATICAQKKINDNGQCGDAPEVTGQIDDVRRALAALPDDAPFAEWGRWILNDRADRPIAPGFKITAAEADELERRLRAGTAFNAAEASP